MCVCLPNFFHFQITYCVVLCSNCGVIESYRQCPVPGNSRPESRCCVYFRLYPRVHREFFLTSLIGKWVLTSSNGKITLFPCGTHRLLAWDFMGPDEEPEVVQATIKARRRRIFHFFLCKHLAEEHTSSLPSDQDGTVRLDEEKATSHEHTISSLQSPGSVHDDGTTVVVQDATKPSQQTLLHAENESAPRPNAQTPSSRYRRLAKHAHSITQGFLNPISITICLCLPISLVPQLKALFVQVPNVHMPPAPDGQPPLAFIQDIATFIGAASIPIGLICLGSSLARLNVPLNQWRTLPVGAILSMTIGKLIIIPVIGVFICKGLVQSGVIFQDDKVLVFITM